MDIHLGRRLLDLVKESLLVPGVVHSPIVTGRGCIVTSTRYNLEHQNAPVVLEHPGAGHHLTERQ